MSDDRRVEDAEIRDVFEEDRPRMAAHPSAGELVAYARGGPSGEEPTLLLEHLGTCRQCTDLLLEWAAPAHEVAEISPVEAAKEVDAILDRARRESTIGPPPPAQLARALPPWTWQVAATVLLATTALLSLLAAGYRRDVDRLESDLARREAPRAGVQIVDLYPGGTPRGGSAAEPAITLAPDAQAVVLILTPPGDPQLGAYLVAIQGGGSETWRGTVRPDPAGSFIVSLPRSFLAPGPLVLKLYKDEGGRERLIETYRVRFTEGR